MKRKVGILVEEGVLRLARHKALEEHRTLSDVILDAIMAYLSGGSPNPKKREKAYQVFCEHPIRITQRQLQEIMAEDAWGL